MKILLVDDERLARFYAQSALEQLLGEENRFYQASGADQAEQILRQYGAPDICFMDYKMPLCNGVELIRRLSPQCPRTIWVLVSGYDLTEPVQNDPSVPVDFVLSKPVSPEELAQVLRKCGVKEVGEPW